MPFTPTHAAAVLPFLRTPLPPSALVIGSIAPDLPYYLPFLPPLPTHTAAAVVSLDVLLGALAWALWHGVLAQPAVAAAPASLRARLPRWPTGIRSRLGSTRAVVLLLAALVLGGATHVLWDEFTHARRWGPEHIPALAARWGPLPGTAWLQHASTLLGALVLLAWLVRWYRRTPAGPPVPRAPAWPWTLLGVVAVGAGIAGVLSAPAPKGTWFLAATWGIGTAAAVALLLALGWHGRRRAGR